MANTFSLQGRGLKLDSAAQVREHCKPLVENSNVEEIILGGNTIGVPAAEELAKILESKHSLRVANLADSFTGRLLSEIPLALDLMLKALLKCPHLHTVNLNDNAFGLNTVEPLRAFLSKHAPLQHLYLNNNGLGPAAGTLVAEALTTLAELKTGSHSPLETVVCGRNRLESGSMGAWVKTFQANRSVKTVKMVQNGIRKEGIATLLQHGLSVCSSLQVLDLQDNTFTSVAAKTLANIVAKWFDLRELGVSDCLLSSRGARVLGEALHQGGNKKLEVLRLQYNEIDSIGLRALVDAASSSALPRLRRVELNGNRFAEDDPSIEKLQSILSMRRSKSASEYPDIDENDEDAWALDELDELEEEEEEEEADVDEGGDEEKVAIEGGEERIIKEADEAEAEPVAEDEDKEIDELSARLQKLPKMS